jgi:mediator of RNA polymerase II transcription subunit 6
LNKFISTASTLPNFSPALGHTYMPPPTAKKAPESQISQTSKENTPMPDSLPGAKKVPATSASSSTYLNERLLADSFRLSLQYGDEFMDENPITGQPGAFNLSTTGRKEKNKLAVPAVANGPTLSQPKTSAPPTPTPELRAGVLPPVRKGSKGDKSPRTPGMPKPKRRKSKAMGSAGTISPT